MRPYGQPGEGRKSKLAKEEKATDHVMARFSLVSLVGLSTKYAKLY